MKKFLTLLCCLLLLSFSSVVSGQDLKGILEKAENLIKNKQYKTSFDLLDNADPKNENPEVVLKKTDLLLNYFASNTMHQTFGLSDLKENETIYEIRGQQDGARTRAYSYYYFEIDTILEKLIKDNPAKGDLYLALGKYYFEVLINYKDKWFKPEKELLVLAETNYTIADKHGVIDHNSLYSLGYLQLLKNDNEKAVTYFLRYLEFDNSNPNANHSLAFAYFQLGKMDDSLKYAENAFNLYNDVKYKTEAARLVADIYKNKNDNTNAIKYYKIAEELSPNNNLHLEALLELYIKTNDLTSAAITADALFALDPVDIKHIQTVFRNYYNNDQKPEFVKFFKRMENKYANRNDVMGNIMFHKGLFYKFEKDPKQATDFLIKAREYFSKCYTKDFYLFKTIEVELKIIAGEFK